jgi:DNA-binding LytR/AlgR family response regulator
MKLNCIIVDDEPLSRGFLKRFCEKSDKAIVKEQFANATDALAYLRSNEIELIFLDVEMPGINGFQMLDHLSSSPKVIMITSKTDYAYTAFEYNVVDFLKKPVTYRRFLNALEKVEKACKHDVITDDSNENNFFIKSNGGHVKLGYDEILYIEGMGDYVKYVTSDKKYITHDTLKAIEGTIGGENFMKVHRSYIVNIKKIKDFADNTVNVHGVSIPVSKSNKIILLQKLGIA